VKEVDADEVTVRFYQEIYDDTGKLVEIHHKYPVDQGHQKVTSWKKSSLTWAESAMMEGEFDTQHFTAIRDVVARLGVADVRAFGLTWDDCEQLLKRLGYAAHVQIMAT
jgi:hypothetical protein